MRKSEDGYTLTELIIVLAVISLSALTAFTMFRTSGIRTLETAARETASAMREARITAVRSGEPQIASIDVVARTLTRATGAARAIPPSIAIEIIGSESERDGPRQTVRFYPDGSSSGARIRLAQRGERLEIAVDWMTGRIDVTRG